MILYANAANANIAGTSLSRGDKWWSSQNQFVSLIASSHMSHMSSTYSEEICWMEKSSKENHNFKASKLHSRTTNTNITYICVLSIMIPCFFATCAQESEIWHVTNLLGTTCIAKSAKWWNIFRIVQHGTKCWCGKLFQLVLQLFWKLNDFAR